MEGFTNENFERPKWHYTYTNNDIPGHPVVFECSLEFTSSETEVERDNIADLQFERMIGRKPNMNYIGRSSIKD